MQKMYRNLAFSLTIALSICACTIDPPVSRVVTYGVNMEPIFEIKSRAAIAEFQRLLVDRKEVRGVKPIFTNVFDIYIGTESVRWIYGPEGYCFIQGKEATVYKVKDNSRLNQIIGVEQAGSH